MNNQGMGENTLNDKVRSFFTGKRGFYFIGISSILIVLLLAYYFAVFSYHKKLFNTYNETVLQEEGADLALEVACREDSSLDSLYHVMAFKKGLLSMAQTDSAGLVISIPDSNIYLQIRGTKVFSTKLKQIRLDRFAGQMGINAYIKNFGKPAKLTSDTCNYEKEPIIHIDAPDDTTEAKSIKHNPDTTISRPVRISYWLDNDLKVNIHGLSPETGGFWRSFMVYLSERIGLVHRFTMNYFSGREDTYLPELTVEVENKEALIIYRALHSRAPVLIYF